MTAAQGTTRSRGTTRNSRRLVVAMAALVVTDLVGGLLAVAAGVNTWAEAWWTDALLAAPVR